MALRRKDLGRWRRWTWAEYAEGAARAGLGLAALGVEPGDRVAVHSENRPEWLMADLGAQGVGAMTVGVYPTSPAAEVEYLLAHSEAVVHVVEDEEQLDKVMAVREKLPALRKIVVIDTRGVKVLDDPMVMTYADLERLGAERPAEWEAMVGRLDPASPAIVVYPSGATGPPKGALLSHANLIAAGRTFVEAFGGRQDDEVLSYLPLCDMAERITSEIDALAAGYIVNFGEGGESFFGDLQEVQPTIFLGVPRVWEEMLAGIEVRMNDAGWVKRQAYHLGLRLGRRVAGRRMQGRMALLDRVAYGVGWLVLYRSLRAKLGLSRVRVAISGAAPIAPQVLEFFWALGVPVREGYGQTEGAAQVAYA